MFNRGTIFCILSTLLIVSGNGEESYRKPKPGSNEFDLLIFTQRWPPTVCFTWKESSESHSCSMPKARDEWTIHGVWPTQFHKVGPLFCNRSVPFDRDAIKPLVSELQERWIDIEAGHGSYSFWEHEWDKHGTCAMVLEKFNTQFKYFRQGLDLLSVYDMKNVLAKSNILPGQTYETTTILNAIKEILGKRAALICRKSKATGTSYIFEIRICFDKNLELVDCDGISDYPTNCASVQGVTYPGEVPPKFEVIQQL